MVENNLGGESIFVEVVAPPPPFFGPKGRRHVLGGIDFVEDETPNQKYEREESCNIKGPLTVSRKVVQLKGPWPKSEKLFN